MAKLRVVLAGGSLVAAMTFGLLCTSPTGVFAQAAKSGVLAGKVDLNSASEAELDKLPGVGKATAKSTPPSTATTPPAVPAPAQSQKAGTPETTKPAQIEAKTPPAAGMVWVNTKSKVFHREGDRWYGKTKEGKFMTEADALKEGYRPSKEGTAKKGAKE